MKTVFTNSMLAHVWAQQSQDDGRNAGGSFYFLGTTIFSYGSHFPIASFTKSDLVLINNATYSNTTAKQQNHVRNAIPSNVRTIYVLDCRATGKSAHNSNLEGLKADMVQSILLASRARKYISMHLESAERSMIAYNDYVIAFKLRRKLFSELPNSAEIKLKAAAAAVNERKAAKRKADKIASDSVELLKEWKTGGDSFINMYSLPVALRVKGENVETTQGASFPVDHAIKAYRTIRALRGTAWTCNGENIRLGHFKIDSINSLGDIVAGCHRIKGEEVRRMGEILLSR